MEISGKIVSILPAQTGQGKNGVWKKQEFVMEIPGEFPKKVCLTVWGDKIDQWGIKQGDPVTASIDIESREYNGRWYTDVKAWKVVIDNQNAGGQIQEDVPDLPPSFGEDEEDIPF
ncbi:MAG: DUF3127 domain-containing protein [Cyclobacteriaceae bacterium]|nr:DUF3127 domain-containing protein [Cyclobacteriaceae bacterium]